MTYRDRRLARADRLRGWSDANATRSDARHAAATAIGDGIPFGQPILVGHHSERRHRRDIGRIESNMRAAVDLDRKAETQARTADSIEAQAAGAIYDDDPDAIAQLTAKLSALESQREEMKTANADYRRQNRAALKEMSAYQRGQSVPYPAYAISNIGGNIGRYRDRLARLEREKVTGPRDRIIAARFDSECAECGARLERGATIRYNRSAGARCRTECAAPAPEPQPAAAAPEPPDGMLF